MIFKIDHISFVCKREDARKYLPSDPAKFIEMEIPNANIKRALMKNVQKTHDLCYFEPKTHLDFPIEYILYDGVGDETSVSIKGDTICSTYSDLNAAYIFLSDIYGERKIEVSGDRISCDISGILDKRGYVLQLRKGPAKTAYLDDFGYGIITSVYNEIHVRNSKTVTVTEKDQIVVNDGRLDVQFARCDAINMIFEFIRPRGKKDI